MLRQLLLSTLAAATLPLPGCMEAPVAPDLTARVVSVVPSGGATVVDPTAPIVITFDHPMRPATGGYAALHEGGVAGPIVSGAWLWSGDRTVLTFVPAPLLRPSTLYTLHLGGGMRAADGGFVDFGPCAEAYGGQWATGQMMGGMMGGGMMAAGWRHPNGTYGMAFTFTTR